MSSKNKGFFQSSTKVTGSQMNLSPAGGSSSFLAPATPVAPSASRRNLMLGTGLPAPTTAKTAAANSSAAITQPLEPLVETVYDMDHSTHGRGRKTRQQDGEDLDVDHMEGVLQVEDDDDYEPTSAARRKLNIRHRHGEASSSGGPGGDESSGTNDEPDTRVYWEVRGGGGLEWWQCRPRAM